MATNTQLATVRAALHSALNTGALAGRAFYAWPGPAGEHLAELIYIAGTRDWDFTIPNMKAGRRQRQERFVFEVVLWVAQPQVSSDQAQETQERIITLFTIMEDALADTPRLGLTGIIDAKVVDAAVEEGPYEQGWAFKITAGVEISARLT